MTTVIVSASAVITPTAVTDLSTSRESRNNVHDILGRPDPDITVRPAASRNGTLELLFAGAGSEDASAAAEQAHATGQAFTIVTDDRPSLAFSYVPSGRLERALTDNRGGWTVAVGYREVVAR